MFALFKCNLHIDSALSITRLHVVLEFWSWDDVSGVERTCFVLSVLVIMLAAFVDMIRQFLSSDPMYRIVGTDYEFLWIHRVRSRYSSYALSE